MFNLCISRFLGTPLTPTDPLGKGSLLPGAPAQSSTWFGVADTLVTSGILASPASVQWIGFPTEGDATAWLQDPPVAALLKTSLVSGYNVPDGSSNVALVVHRWRPWSGVLPSRNCPPCPPGIGSGMPAWFGGLLPNHPSPSAPAQMQVLMFTDAADLASWLTGTAASMFMDNTLYATRIP